MTAADKFITDVKRYMLENAMPPPGSRLVVALSGGADSVALLSVLCELGYECIAAHSNFRLRGEESMRDCRHAIEVAGQLGVDICVRDMDVAERMRQTGESVEMACRALRYAWFTELLEESHARAIAVGHHREDSAETVILNLMRSTGIAGLTGISPVSAHVIRPLLGSTRAQIEDYLDRRGLTWVDDSTNATNDFRRNAVRNRLMPMLVEIFGTSTDAILSTVAHLAEARVVVDRAVRQVAQQIVQGNRVDVARLATDTTIDPSADFFLHEILRPLGFNRATTDNILRSVRSGRSGMRFDGTGHHAILDRGVLTLSSMLPGDNTHYDVSLNADIVSPIYITITCHDIVEFDPEALEPDAMYMDITALEGNPRWQLRHRLKGDRMRPFGMGGRSKLVSDIMTQAKLDTAAKQSAWLLTRDDVPVWIVGLRTSNDFALTPSTRRFLKLSIRQHE